MAMHSSGATQRASDMSSGCAECFNHCLGDDTEEELNINSGIIGAALEENNGDFGLFESPVVRPSRPSYRLPAVLPMSMSEGRDFMGTTMLYMRGVLRGCVLEYDKHLLFVVVHFGRVVGLDHRYGHAGRASALLVRL